MLLITLAASVENSLGFEKENGDDNGGNDDEEDQPEHPANQCTSGTLRLLAFKPRLSGADVSVCISMRFVFSRRRVCIRVLELRPARRRHGCVPLLVKMDSHGETLPERGITDDCHV